MIDLRQLRHFVVVSEEMNFRRAAQRLCMTQPPLTQSIQAIEAELGVHLFERSRRHVALTQAGEVLLVQARATLAQAQQMMHIAQRAARGEVGTLRVGVSISASFATAFTRAMHAFQRRYPDVSLQLSRVTASSGISGVQKGEIDVCITRVANLQALPDTLASLCIARDTLRLVVHVDDEAAQGTKPLALHTLMNRQFLLYSREQGTAIYRQVAQLLGALGVSPPFAQELGDGPMIMGLVAGGYGVSILPDSLQTIQIKDVAWRDIDADPALTQSAIVAVFAPDSRREVVPATFIDLLTQTTQQGA